MTNIPIVFSFNHWILKESGVSISSLLRHAKPTTFYNINVLHGIDDLNSSHKATILKLIDEFKNCTISFVEIDSNFFNNVHIARGVPKVTYYRFFIPHLFPQFDKIIFSDPDIIYRGDLSDVFENTDLTINYLAAVKSAFVKKKYIYSIGCDPLTYTNGGFQIYNLKAFRENDIESKQIAMINEEYFYLDQDITNIVCKDKITFLSPKYNATQSFFKHSMNESHNKRILSLFSEKEIKEGLFPIVHHFNGIKPWNGMCYKHDVYWEEYRNSQFFDPTFYYKHYIKLMNPNPSSLLAIMPKSILKKIFGKFKDKYIDQ